jgi:hypothetical protein
LRIANTARLSLIFGLASLVLLPIHQSTILPLSNSLSKTPSGYWVQKNGNPNTYLFKSAIMESTTMAADFALSATPSTFTIQPGSSDTSLITVTGSNAFNSTVNMTASVTSGLTVYLSATTVRPNATDTLTIQVATTTAPGLYIVDVRGASGSLNHDQLLTVNVAGFRLTVNHAHLIIENGTSKASTIQVTAKNGFFGRVTLEVDSQPGLNATLSEKWVFTTGTSVVTLTAINLVPGTYLVNITGTSGLAVQTATINVTIPLPDFILSTPSAPSANVGSSATATIIVGPPLYGFMGMVDLTDYPSSGLVCGVISPSNISVSRIATVTCSAMIAGTYSLTVTGTSGLQSHSATTTFTFQDFTITASSPATVGTETASISTITIAPVNGFGRMVNLSDNPSTGLTCSTISDTSISGSGSATVSCNAVATGTYILNIVGTNDSLTHTTTATFTYATPDFTVNTENQSLNLISGTSATTTVTITPEYEFSGNVTLTVNSPRGVSCSLSPTTIQSSGTSTLTCRGNSQGDYTVTISAQSGSTGHSSSVSVHVASVSPAAPAQSTIIGLTPIIFYSIIGVTVIGGLAGAVLVLRRPKHARL